SKAIAEPILSPSARRAQHGSRPRCPARVIVRGVSFATIDELEAGLRGARYLPERGLATALYLSLALEKPLLLEGEAGVGKTEAAKALAQATSSRLIRLQCYEGLDVAHAVYEWNYSRQLLHIRAAQEGTVSEQELFGPDFLIRRPLLGRDIEIVGRRVPGIPARLAGQAAAFVQGLRRLDLAKPPGVAETIDWAQALAALGRQDLDARTVEDTLGSVLKYHEDFAAVRDEALVALVEEARTVAAGAV